MRDGKWKYTIRAYDGKGALVIETGHATEASRNIELKVFEQRMRRHDETHIAYVDIISHVEPFGTQTITAAN